MLLKTAGAVLSKAVVAAALGVAGLSVFGLTTCAVLDHQVAKGRLPSSVEVSRVTAVSQMSGGLEACIYVAYSITPASAARLEQGGLAFLEGARPSEDDARNPFGVWRRTPLAIDERRRVRLEPGGGSIPLFALGANEGCGDGKDRPVDARRLLGRPGSFYSVTQNGEGLVVINPASAAAAFLYFG